MENFGYNPYSLVYLLKEEIDEADEKLLEEFLSKDAGRQLTLADHIIKKIKASDANVSAGLIIFIIHMMHV